MPPKKKQRKPRKRTSKEQLAEEYAKLRNKRLEKQIEALEQKKAIASMPKAVRGERGGRNTAQQPAGTVNVPIAQLLARPPMPLMQPSTQQWINPNQVTAGKLSTEEIDRKIANQFQQYFNKTMKPQESAVMEAHGDLTEKKKALTPVPTFQGAFDVKTDMKGNVIQESPLIKEIRTSRYETLPIVAMPYNSPMMSPVRLPPRREEDEGVPMDVVVDETPLKGNVAIIEPANIPRTLEGQLEREALDELTQIYERVRAKYPKALVEQPVLYAQQTSAENRKRLYTTKSRWRFKYPNAFN